MLKSQEKERLGSGSLGIEGLVLSERRTDDVLALAVPVDDGVALRQIRLAVRDQVRLGLVAIPAISIDTIRILACLG